MWLVLGGSGQLGLSFNEFFKSQQIEHVSLDRQSCDITNLTNVEKVFEKHRPIFVVNCAAWTAVDDAEDHLENALLINRDGARNVAAVCRNRQIKLIHISTDYVFAGTGKDPYQETDFTAPVSAYGISKLAGEQSVLEEHPEQSLIVRTAWLYSKHGKNFVKTMVKKALQQEAVNVVNDQIGQPTYTYDLVNHVYELAQSTSATGVFHGTNSGHTTWFDLTVEIYSQLGVDTSLVRAVPSSAYPTKAIRPKNSVLSHARTIEMGIREMRGWKIALQESIQEIRDVVVEEIHRGN